MMFERDIEERREEKPVGLNYVQQAEVDIQITKQIEYFTSKFNEQLKWMESNKEEIEQQLPKIRQELRDTVADLFSNKDFMEQMYKHLHRFVEQEVAAQIKEKHLHEMATALVMQKIEIGFKPLVEEVVNRVFKQMNKSFEERLTVTRQIVYSLESDIRHTLQKLPITESEEKIVRDAVLRLQKKSFVSIEDVRGA
jgi:ribosome recycling factor